MTTKRERVNELITRTYQQQQLEMFKILNELITEDSLQTQDGEKVTMESRFTDLENQVKSLTSELGQTKKDDSTELDAEKMKTEIAELRQQLEEQKEMQLAGQNMQATIAQLQTEVQAQRQLNKDLLQEVQKMQMCNASVQRELDAQKKLQVDIKKLQKQIKEQIMKEIKQEIKPPSPPRAARRVYTPEYIEAFQRIQAAEKEVQDLKSEVRCLKSEKMKEKQFYDESMQSAEERNQQFRDAVLKRLENVEDKMMALEVHTDRNTKERQDLAGKLDRRTFDNFTVQICQTMKQQIEEGLKGHDEKWTAMLEKNKEEIEKTKENMEKKLDKMEEYIYAMEKRLRKTIEDLMVPPPKEVDEAAISTSKCLTCSRNVDTTTIKNVLPCLPALPSPPSQPRKPPITAGKPARYNETIFPTNPQKRFGAVIKGTLIPPIRTGTPIPPIRKTLLPEVLKTRHKGKQ
ncbi:uncharacterized protein [Aquarana catesbeiana]|uniref:uncharacterized protein n=1 Tax=Aquarana catesbeiana TaxID=8400 RepID=UPI003CC9CF70